MQNVKNRKKREGVKEQERKAVKSRNSQNKKYRERERKEERKNVPRKFLKRWDL